jgi:hypothetical protein
MKILAPIQFIIALIVTRRINETSVPALTCANMDTGGLALKNPGA